MSVLIQFRSMAMIAASLAVATVLACTTPVAAQFGEAAGIGEAMQPDYYKRDVVIISQGLNLDESQRIIVNTMYEDYQTAFEAGLNAMKQRFEDMKGDLQAGGQAEDKDRIMLLVFAPILDWMAKKDDIGAQFLANIEVVLTDDQKQLYPAIQRRLYRERKLHKGRLSGESLNLIDVVRDLSLDKRVNVQIQPMLDAYDAELDRALHQREDPITGRNNPMLKSLEEQDPAKQHEALRKQIARRIVVRNVNDKYIEQLALALPEDQARQFRAAALERAYPRIYRETPVQRIFRVAAEMEGLDSSVRQAVLTLEGEFLAELAVINQNLLNALRTNEPIEAEEQAADFAMRMAGQQIEPKPDPTRELFAARDEMSRGYVKRLKALITEDQFAMLPGAYRWIDMPAPPVSTSHTNGAALDKSGKAGVGKGGKGQSDGGAKN